MNLTLLFFVSFFLYSTKVLLLDSHSCGGDDDGQEQRSRRGVALLNSTYTSHFKIYYPSCVRLCVADLRCMSLNFWWKTYKCDLNNQSRKTCPKCYVIEDEATYQGMLRHPASLQNFKPESCSAIKKFHPTLESGTYVIDPDGEGSGNDLAVTCDMTDKDGVGVTIVSHNSEERTLVKGCEPRGCYKREVVYTGTSLSQLACLTEVSSHCEQFIKYECFANFLLRWGNTWWVSRDSERMSYWGGASPDSNNCACGMNKSCIRPERGCNCDSNDEEWREDSGFLKHKAHLPVSQLRIGDLSYPPEHGYYTLGKLKCYGSD